ncbi:hypothetical protein AALP_AA4G156600 [Arabis alpina]|uniref:Uncharacterized protein n=1 Tax=Arabis alpina TaxID=50452 RepID=A0A087H3I8_ARAAL|nr:hypothetical protein AALP_AA4G156600 [Arabis alpina]
MSHESDLVALGDPGLVVLGGARSGFASWSPRGERKLWV